MEMEYDFIKENGNDYLIVKERNNYALLVNDNNLSDILIKKIKNENGEKLYCSLDSEEEFDKAFSLFEEE